MAEAVRPGGAHLLDLHSDADHNRTVVTLVSADEARLRSSLLNLVAAAGKRIDLSRHEGVHPRVGAVDVVPLVPLGSASMERCVELAHALGRQVWEELHVPVYFYGLASRRAEATSLAAIRAGRVQLDFGASPDPAAGAVCIGARPPMVAYNVMLEGATLAQGAALARLARESSGGLAGVQALAFELPGGRIQIAMNLTRLEVTSPLDALAEVTRLAEEAGIEVGAEELVGLCPARSATTPAAAGRLLEGRLSAVAAHAGAAWCRQQGDRERVLVAERLEHQGMNLLSMGAGQNEILDAAELSVAMGRVLTAAGCSDPEIAAMFSVAAAGFVEAVSAESRIRHAARVQVLPEP